MPDPVNKDEFLSEAQRQGMFARVTPKSFIVELVIDGKPYKSVASALNLESMLALLSVTVAANLPRTSGYNVYSSDGELLASVNAVDFMAAIKPLEKDPDNLSATPSGWRAVPVKQTATEDFQKMIEKAREEERKAKASGAQEVVQPRPSGGTPQ